MIILVTKKLNKTISLLFNTKKYIICIYTFWMSGFVCAQPSVAEWQMKLQNAKHDTSKLACFMWLAKCYEHTNLDSTYFFLQKAEPLSKQYPNDIGAIRYFNTSGTYWRFRGNLNKALNYYEEGLKLATRLGNDSYIKSIRFNKTELLRLKGANHLAIKELLALEVLADAKNDSSFKRSVYSALVSNYNDLMKTEKAIYYSSKILKYAHSKYDSVKYYEQTSSINTQQDTLIKKLDSLKIALFPKYFALAKELKDMDVQQVILLNVSNAYLNSKEYNKALDCLKEVSIIAEQKGVIDYKPSIAHNFGNVYYAMGQYSKAIPYFQQAILGLRNDDKGAYVRALESISKTYAALGDFKNAYNHHLEATTIKEEMAGTDRQKIVAELEAQYELSDKQKQIANKELENKLQEERIKTVQSQKYILIGLFCLVSMLFFWALWNYRQKNKLSQVLSTQKTQLEEQTYLLTNLNQVKDKLFTIVAHDLKQPAVAFQKLGTVINQLIKKKDIERLEKVGKYAESMSNNLHLTIENLFRWGTLQQRQVLINKNEVDINALLRDIYDEFEPIAQSKSISFKADIPSNCHIITDSSILTAILRNILSNAIKFTPEGKDIKMEAVATGQKLVISIKDKGIGMPIAIQKDLFILNPAKKREGTNKEQGSGLGLTLCKQLSDLAEIGLDCRSKEGEGTDFIVTCRALNGVHKRELVL